MLLSRAERINENTRSVREAMIPSDKITEWYDLEKSEHLRAMWDEYYNSGAEFESYVHYRSRPVLGDFYGVTEAGYRQVENQGPWPIEEDNFNVFFFGDPPPLGSGLIGQLASYLQEALNERGVANGNVKSYNFGRSGYFSSQEQILFHKLISQGAIPDLVVFMDGLNDFCFRDGQPSGWQQLAAYFNSVNDAAQARSAGYGIVTDWQKLGDFVTEMPLLRFIAALLDRFTEQSIPAYTGPSGTIEEAAPPVKELETVLDRYINNIRQVEAVGKQFGIQSYFIWQPIPTYAYDPKYHMFSQTINVTRVKIWLS